MFQAQKLLFFLINSLFKNKKNIIPFKNDLLFNFFNKKTVITDTYLLDPVSALKLYPKKSNNLVTTSINTQFHVAKDLVDYTLGFEISVDFYYDPATLSMSNYNAVCGRSINTTLHSGMFLPGLTAANFFYAWWRNTSANSAISKSGLTADWYRYSMIVTATTVQVKLLNLRTNVLLSGNVAAVGTVDTADNTDFTFLCYGNSGNSGNYGSVGVNYSNIKILRGSTCLLNVPLSEGVSDKVTDICNSSQYQITFFTTASGWAKLSNYHHYNFRYGYTLYQKTGENNLYIPNTTAQNEIILAAAPAGYTRVANYKESRQTFNQCESVFVLDNTTVASVLRCSAAGTAAAIGDYIFNSSNSRWENAATGAYIHLFGSEWYWKNSVDTLLYYGTAPTTPANVISWFRASGAAPAPSQLQSVLITTDLYNADVDHFLFTENTGIAKELTIQNIDVDDGFDRGHLYINPNPNEKNLMLYKTDKTLTDDVKILKYIGIGDEIVTDETGDVVYDDNDHAIFEVGY